MTLQKIPLPQTNMGFSGFDQRRKRWDDGIPWLEFPDGKWLPVRFFGRTESIVHMVATHWLVTLKNKKRFPMLCPNFNPETRKFEDNGCPICGEFDPFNSENEVIKAISPRLSGLSHAIVRNIQRAGGAGNPDWKPWRPVRLPISVLILLQKLKDLNLHTIEGVQYPADVSDPYYGRDINILYDSQGANPQSKYSIDRGDHTPLTEEEQGYIKEIYDFGSLVEYPDKDEIKKALTQNGYYQLLKTGAVAVPDDIPPRQETFSKEPPPPPTAKAPTPPISTGGIDIGKTALETQPGTLTEDEIPFNPGSAVAAPAAQESKAAKAPNESTKQKLQALIYKYSEKLTRAKPMKIWDSGELKGVEVLACYGTYQGDMSCVRCPTRKSCLSA